MVAFLISKAAHVITGEGDDVHGGLRFRVGLPYGEAYDDRNVRGLDRRDR